MEGVPGLAKTLAIKTLASLIDAKYSRIQFTPDLLPADVIGTMVYSQKDESFKVQRGPIFANFVLADEINRAPAKVQSALLEAMQERQVTIGKETFMLPEPFLVLATQNPIEQEGTYPLPEAQVDRFMLKVVIDYPKLEEELDTLKTVKRSEIAEKIKVARGYGDLSENAEYDAAKEEQAVVEARIADLEATLKVARIMDDSDLSLDTVSIGMHVRILAEGDEPDEAEEYDITGSTEADIDQGRISDESPVGAALIGHKAGDKVDVTLPSGNILEYTILGVSRSR